MCCLSEVICSIPGTFNFDAKHIRAWPLLSLCSLFFVYSSLIHFSLLLFRYARSPSFLLAASTIKIQYTLFFDIFSFAPTLLTSPLPSTSFLLFLPPSYFTAGRPIRLIPQSSFFPLSIHPSLSAPSLSLSLYPAHSLLARRLVFQIRGPRQRSIIHSFASLCCLHRGN